MVKFKVGDRVKSVRTGRKGTLLSMVRGRDVLADRLGALWNVKFDDGAEGMLREGTELTLANSCATNAKFKVGDRVETEWGTGRIIRVGGVEKFGGEETYAVILDKRPYGRATYFKEHQIKPYQKFPNASAVRSCNAEPSAQLKKAYDEWKKAEEKFKKWWNPDRRLSERPPAGADGAKKAVEFSELFFRETGRRPPNGYGNMTLEQMMASNSVRSTNAVVAKAINAQRAARNAAYPKAIDKDLGNFTGMVMPVYNLFSLEYGDVHSTKPEDQYVGIEGTVAEVKAKAQRTFKGKNLTDAMALCAWASAEMEKYAKSERAHGRRHTNACGTQK